MPYVCSFTQKKTQELSQPLHFHHFTALFPFSEILEKVSANFVLMICCGVLCGDGAELCLIQFKTPLEAFWIIHVVPKFVLVVVVELQVEIRHRPAASSRCHKCNFSLSFSKTEKWVQNLFFCQCHVHIIYFLNPRFEAILSTLDTPTSDCKMGNQQVFFSREAVVKSFDFAKIFWDGEEKIHFCLLESKNYIWSFLLGSFGL